MLKHLNLLRKRFPNEANTLYSIKHLRKQIERLPLESFFEPKSLFDLSESKPILIAVGLDDLNAWRHHVVDGCIVRLTCLEDAIFIALVNKHLTAAMVLTRAHMEVAGLSAYITNALFSNTLSNDLDRLTKLVQKTYFGSSMRIQAKRTPKLNDILMEETYPLKPTDLIKAMDRFAMPDDLTYTHYQLIYGLLCEFAHPAMRATKQYAKARRSGIEGWRIRYYRTETLNRASLHMACDILLNNMRVGYACCKLLRCSNIELTPGGDFVLSGTSVAQFTEIWKDILQQPLP